jgi:hypothetical protein
VVELNHLTAARLQRDAELLADLGSRLDSWAADLCHIRAADEPAVAALRVLEQTDTTGVGSGAA